MSEDALSRAMRINGLLTEWQKRVSGESSNNPLRVVGLLGANPFITTRGVTDKLAIAYDRAARHRATLERAHILTRVFTRLNADENEVSLFVALCFANDSPCGVHEPHACPGYGSTMRIENLARDSPRIRGRRQMQRKRQEQANHSEHRGTPRLS